jgi:hypothetical protein
VGWVLAVDFGTSNTTAAFADDGAPAVVLEVDNSKYLPSVVMADEAGTLVTGKAAARQALAFPDRAERVPKRALVNGGPVVLGGREFAAAARAAAVLTKVYGEAVRFHGGTAPSKVILTHPARWGQPLLGRLREAAALAGITDPALLSEPEAAAWFYSPPLAGQVVAVFDLGGGTLDTAVLRAAGGGFEIAGPPGGDADLGGEDFDGLLLDWVGELARERDADAWEELSGDGRRAARDRARLRAEVTAAKEALSDHPFYSVVVDGFAEEFRVTRSELEKLIGPPVQRAVEEMARTIRAAGITGGQLAGLYLTGGSSRTPLIAQQLAAALDVLPQLRDDPKAVVALGALSAHHASDTRRPAAARTPPEATALPGRELLLLPHDDEVRSVAFSPDGARLATGSRDDLARVWDVGTGREIVRLPHGGGVWWVAFSPDGARLATVSDDHPTRVWDVGTCCEIVRLPPAGPVQSVAFSPDGTLATGRWDNLAQVWDVGTCCEIARLPHGDTVMSVAFSPDGTRLATGSSDGLARVWDAGTGRVIARLPHGGLVQSVAFSPDGARLATGSSDDLARVWDVGTGREIVRLPHGGVVFSVAFSPDGARLATGSRDDLARVWDAGTGREIARLPHGGVVFSVAFSPDGARLATGSHDNLARIWDPA